MADEEDGRVVVCLPWTLGFDEDAVGPGGCLHVVLLEVDVVKPEGPVFEQAWEPGEECIGIWTQEAFEGLRWRAWDLHGVQGRGGLSSGQAIAFKQRGGGKAVVHGLGGPPDEGCGEEGGGGAAVAVVGLVVRGEDLVGRKERVSLQAAKDAGTAVEEFVVDERGAAARPVGAGGQVPDGVGDACHEATRVGCVAVPVHVAATGWRLLHGVGAL